MTDYLKTTGTTGQMMIRDTGTVVEMWFKAGYSNDHWAGLSFGYTANGASGSGTIDYPTGAQWYKVFWFTITSSQTVTFKLNTATGTSGMGGPTTMSQFIDRGDNPSPPSTPKLTNIKSTSVDVSFTDGNNGGLTIDSRQIGYGTDPAATQTIVSSDGSTTITGLQPGTQYYFWARTHNSKGYSYWSPRATCKTLNVPSQPVWPTVSSITQTSAVVTIKEPADDGGTPFTNFQIGYGTSAAAPTWMVAAEPGANLLQGLSPGVKYYVFTRAQNSVGWSNWSLASTLQLIAGAYVKVGTEWKRAVPYVNVGGVWKVARPWARVAGIWKEST